MRFVVLGDIHGRLDALEALLRGSGAVDAEGCWAGQGFTLVQLGDLVDRGPDSRACVERVRALQSEAGERAVIVLRGNHEQMLLDSFKGPAERLLFLSNGGGATMRSYGGDFEALCGQGGRHWKWLAGLPLTFEYEGVLFVHGGVKEGLAGQANAQELLWARPPLDRGGYRALVVGHTPTQSGRIEVEGGVFRCDIGLGYYRESSLQYLEMDIGPKALRWKVVEL